ncbi:MAG: NADH-quinone oxidoreductase subunit C, partial [Myxococcota bacterium]
MISATVDARATRPAHDWRAEVVAAVRGGQRLVSLFGRPGGEAVRLTAVTQRQDGALGVLRADVDPAEGYHTLTDDVPPAAVFERELHEACGVRVRGHPWLKPIRFSGGANVDDYPFLHVDGKQVHEVQVGPIHAGVIEPGAFRFLCHGEQVLHLEIHLGYQHRGVGALLRGADPWRSGPMVEVVAGDTSIGHGWAWAGAVEALAGVEPD